MKLCSFEVATSLGRHTRLGAMLAAGIVDLNFACAWHLASKGEARPYGLAEVLVPDDMLAFLQGEETSMGFARAVLSHVADELSADRRPQGLNGETLIYPTDSVRLKAPLQNPICLRSTHPDGPPLATKGIVGPGDEVTWPEYARKLGYEPALAIVVGKAGHRIPNAAAGEYVAGVTVLNFFRSADGLKHTTTAMGPMLITRDEEPDVAGALLRVTANGVIQWDSTLTPLLRTLEKGITEISHDEVLSPGEILSTPFPNAREQESSDRKCTPDEEVVLSCEQFGTLRNRVVRI